MRTLGASWATDRLYLAIAENGTVLDAEPHSFMQPVGLAEIQRLPAATEEARKIVSALEVQRVAILEPESNVRGGASMWVPRISVETIFMLGSSAAGIECTRMNRPRLRSMLGLPRGGNLASLADQVTPAVGTSWRNKRDLAAMTALAAGKVS